MTSDSSSSVLAAACVFAALGCSRTPAPTGVGAPNPGASTVAAGTPAASASPAGPGATSAAAVLPDGCWSGFSTDVPASAAAPERLKALAERCAQGMKPIPPASATAMLGAGQTRRHDFEVGSGTGCIRVLAAGGTGVSDLALDLFDGRAGPRGGDQLKAPFALAPAQGNACLESGKYHAVVSVTSGAGPVALSAFAVE